LGERGLTEDQHGGTSHRAHQGATRNLHGSCPG
jgi:hypothetical protein